MQCEIGPSKSEESRKKRFTSFKWAGGIVKQRPFRSHRETARGSCNRLRQTGLRQVSAGVMARRTGEETQALRGTLVARRRLVRLGKGLALSLVCTAGANVSGIGGNTLEDQRSPLFRHIHDFRVAGVSPAARRTHRNLLTKAALPWMLA